MQTSLCAICGWDFKENYSVGDICPCCNSEYGFNDFLEKGEILCLQVHMAVGVAAPRTKMLARLNRAGDRLA